MSGHLAFAKTIVPHVNSVDGTVHISPKLIGGNTNVFREIAFTADTIARAEDFINAMWTNEGATGNVLISLPSAASIIAAFETIAGVRLQVGDSFEVVMSAKANYELCLNNQVWDHVGHVAHVESVHSIVLIQNGMDDTTFNGCKAKGFSRVRFLVESTTAGSESIGFCTLVGYPLAVSITYTGEI